MGWEGWLATATKSFLSGLTTVRQDNCDRVLLSCITDGGFELFDAKVEGLCCYRGMVVVKLYLVDVGIISYFVSRRRKRD